MLFYDKDNKFVSAQSVPVSGASNNAWVKLTLPTFTASQDGYVQVLVANESNADVWFDELSITQTEALVVQENHYDPWGLNLAGIEQQGQPDDKFQYNGIEKEDALGLNWNMADFRSQDPQLGRLWQIDPILLDPWPDIENKENISPYAWVQNNPVNYSDMLGLDTVYHNNDLPENWDDFKPDEDQVLLDEVVITPNSEPEESSGLGDGSSAAASAVAISLILEGGGVAITIPQLVAIGMVVATVDWLIHPSSHGLRMTPGLDGSAGFNNRSIPTGENNIRKFSKSKSSGKLKGGKQGARDRDFGVKDKDFWQWWHRKGKKDNGGQDLTEDEAAGMYKDWIDNGKPKGPK